MTAELLDAALTLLDRYAVLAEAVPPLRLWLSEDGPGFCLHEPVRQFTGRTAAIDRWIRSVAEVLPGDVLPGADAVHYDFTPANFLACDGVLTGVVDWMGAGRGDRSLDLVALRFGLESVDCDDGVVERVDTLIDQLPPALLRPAWAHMSLRMTDWTIRHHPDSVTTWIELAEQRTD